MSTIESREPTMGFAEHVDLAWAMAEAARQLGQTGNVPTAMSQVVWLARDLIPAAEHVVVSVASRSRIETVAASDQFVNRLDQLQYELNEGLCVDAMTGHTQMVVKNMEAETRWPRFAPRAFAEGVVSQMGIQVFQAGSSVGGLNMYSTKLDALMSVRGTPPRCWRSTSRRSWARSSPRPNRPMRFSLVRPSVRR